MFVVVIVAFVESSPSFVFVFNIFIEVFFIANIKSIESIKASIPW